MNYNYDKAFIRRDSDNNIFSYVLINTDAHKMVFSPTLNRNYFLNAFEFSKATVKDDSNVNYPIILDDYTTREGIKLEEIKLTDIPKDILKRYRQWRKWQ